MTKCFFFFLASELKDKPRSERAANWKRFEGVIYMQGQCIIKFRCFGRLILNAKNQLLTEQKCGANKTPLKWLFFELLPMAAFTFVSFWFWCRCSVHTINISNTNPRFASATFDMRIGSGRPKIWFSRYQSIVNVNLYRILLLVQGIRAMAQRFSRYWLLSWK